MYVTDKDINTVSELQAMIDGALEAVDGVDENGVDLEVYWQDFATRASVLFGKMIKQRDRQDFSKEVQKHVRRLRKERSQ